MTKKPAHGPLASGAGSGAASDPSSTATSNPVSADRRSTTRLVSDVPRLTIELVQAELASLIAEAKARLIAAGIGAGLLVAAALFGFFGLATLIAAAVLGLATVLNGWLAALLVMVGLLVVVAVAALAGVRSLRRGLHGERGDEPDEPDEQSSDERKDAARGA